MSESKTTAPQKAAATAQAPSKLITELKVSAHLMSLDAGLFCIFIPPNSPPSDAQSGFPGIRISLPPGPAFRPEAITISTFRDDGWLGGWNGAALVRVARGPAQILVTIYQAPHAKGDAPKLQIMRLTEGQPVVMPGQAQEKPPAPAQVPKAPVALAAPPAETKPEPPAAAPAAAKSAPQNTPPAAASDTTKAEMVAHIQSRGDVACALADWMGEPGSKNWIEGFAIAPKHVISAADIEYQAVLGRGWLSPWAEGGQFCGSRGMSLPILGLRVRLRGQAADAYDCALTASFVDGTRVGPLDNGEPCQSESLAPLEAFHLEIMPRGGKEAAPSDAKAPAAKAPVKSKAGKPVAEPPAPVKTAPKPAKRK